MKVAVIGICDFPFGKKNLPDERLDKLSGLLRSSKVTAVQIDFKGPDYLKEAEVLLCENKSKLDLILKDLEIIEQRLFQREENKALFSRCKESLEREIVLNEAALTEEEKKILSAFNLITLKPIILISEQEIDSLPAIIKKVFDNSGRLCFFTANEKELRAWAIRKGATAYEAAGLIHSDIQRGFIRAEIINYDDLIKVGGLNQAKAAGRVKLETKEYIVKDGDLLYFRFSR
jgi:ribosome-binding ATPase YchF (GTP1/OBG family)